MPKLYIKKEVFSLIRFREPKFHQDENGVSKTGNFIISNIPEHLFFYLKFSVGFVWMELLNQSFPITSEYKEKNNQSSVQ